MSFITTFCLFLIMILMIAGGGALIFISIMGAIYIHPMVILIGIPLTALWAAGLNCLADYVMGM